MATTSSIFAGMEEVHSKIFAAIVQDDVDDWVQRVEHKVAIITAEC